MDSSNRCVDGIRYGDSTWTGCGLSGISPSASEPDSLQRLRSGNFFQDTDDMASDFAEGTPTPGYSYERPILSIVKAKKHSNGSAVHVRGNVTVPKGTFVTTEIYIQDDTGGIKIYKSFSSGGIAGTVSLGTLIDVTGVLMEYGGEREIDISSPTSTMVNLGSIRFRQRVYFQHLNRCEKKRGIACGGFFRHYNQCRWRAVYYE